MTSQYLLETIGLSKLYAKDRGAVDINLHISPGEIVGFIGPNGAGKTTTMRMIMGFISQDRGILKLFGSKINNLEDRLQLIHNIGFLAGENVLYEHFTGYQLCQYASNIYGSNFKKEVDRLAKLLDVEMNRKIKYLSQGNKQKIGIIHAVIHKPRLVILDEPTSGLDPLVQQNFLQIIKDIRDAGGAVFLSSHVLSEIEAVCDRIIMIKDSHVILEDSTNTILEKALKRFKLFKLNDDLLKQIQKIEQVKRVDRSGEQTYVYVSETKPIIELLVKNSVYDFYLERPKLEEMFLESYR